MVEFTRAPEPGAVGSAPSSFLHPHYAQLADAMLAPRQRVDTRTFEAIATSSDTADVATRHFALVGAEARLLATHQSTAIC